jgi:hypothetical protein
MSITIEDGYKPRSESCSGNEEGYTVEARVDWLCPVQIGTQLFDNRWRGVKYDKGVIGVPSADPYQKYVIEHGMFSYAAAQALRWWLIASAEATKTEVGLETRLMKHRISYTQKVEFISGHSFIDRRGSHFEVDN